jgi:hypothetical protein
MGQERECAMRLGRKNWAGKASLETDFLLFRGSAAGEGVRVKIGFAEMKKVAAEGGWLKVDYMGGPAWFELGGAAAKWADKILNPPSRMDKLGVKAGVAVAIEGELEAEFVKELGATVKRGADLLFFGAKRAADLEKIGKLKARLTEGGAIWVIYPKGKAEIREIEVIAAGRAAGLKDTKVTRFSETHTGLRFSTPRE